MIGGSVDGRLCDNAHHRPSYYVSRVVRPTRDLDEGDGGRSGISGSTGLGVGTTHSPRDCNASGGVARGKRVPRPFIRPKRLKLILPLVQEDVRPCSAHQAFETSLDPCCENKSAQHAGPGSGGTPVSHQDPIGQDCARQGKKRRLIPNLA
jgi:hypothetical protein